MACNLISALKDAKTCKIAMAGTGDRVFFFDKDELLAEIKDAIDGGETEKYGAAAKLPEPGEKGIYAPTCAFELLTKKNTFLAAVDIKTDSGQVTSEKGADNEANSLIGTFVVADNVMDFNELEHALRFKDFGCLIPKVGGGYYVIMSPYKKSTIESNYDSGTTYDSDHGFTVTVTAAPAEYGITVWTPEVDLSSVAIENA